MVLDQLTKVFQTKYGKGLGNCLQAAFASILDLPLESVPDFADYGPGMLWFDPAVEWLRSVGYGFVYWHDIDSIAAINCYALAFCCVVDETERHAVVVRFERDEGEDPDKFYWRAEIAHDPNERGGYVLGNIEEYMMPVRLC